MASRSLLPYRWNRATPLSSRAPSTSAHLCVSACRAPFIDLHVLSILCTQMGWDKHHLPGGTCSFWSINAESCTSCGANSAVVITVCADGTGRTLTPLGHPQLQVTNPKALTLNHQLGSYSYHTRQPSASCDRVDADSAGAPSTSGDKSKITRLASSASGNGHETP